MSIWAEGIAPSAHQRAVRMVLITGIGTQTVGVRRLWDFPPAIQAAWQFRRFGIALLAFLILIINSDLAHAARHALLIGNAGYTHTPRLINPPKDVADLAKKLESHGFKTTTHVDLDAKSARTALDGFIRSISSGDTVVFYYAGHAVQITGQNFLLPVDIKNQNLGDVLKRALSLKQALSALHKKAGKVIVFLDACRDNPFGADADSSSILAAQPAGLARENLAAKDTFIAFATDPGNVADDGEGENSPFAEAILATIDKPGLEINHLMTEVRRMVFVATQQRQLPWSNSSLLEQFYFTRTAAAVSTQPRGRTSAEVTDPAALLAAANRLLEEQGFAKAAQTYEKAAKLGSTRAMTMLGNLMSLGVGVPKDQKGAFDWFRKAADAGDPDAQFLIGKLHETGEGGVKRNRRQAADWYRKAADSGNADAMNNLATMLIHGEGVPKDRKTAIDWYDRASKKGNGLALYNLASMYEEGTGVPRSETKAAKLMMRSIFAGTEGAKLEMLNNSARWSRNFRKAFQTELKELGHYSGTIDGAFGRGTKAAINKLKPQE